MNLTPHEAYHAARLTEAMIVNEACRHLARYFDSRVTPLLPARVPARIPAATKPLPTIDVIPTPAVSTVTRKQAGAAGILVSFKELSVQATETNLAEAIAAVVPTPKAPVHFAIGDKVAIPSYQGKREVIDIERAPSGSYFYVFNLGPSDRNTRVRFLAARIDFYNVFQVPGGYDVNVMAVAS